MRIRRTPPHGTVTCGNLLCENNGWHMTWAGLAACDRREAAIRGTDAEVALLAARRESVSRPGTGDTA